MTRLAVVTDSTADIPAELAAHCRVSVVPLTVSLGGQSYQDGVEITPGDFYQRLGRLGGSATTSQPSPGRFAGAFEALLKTHDEVISIHLSQRLSGTYAAAVQGAALVESGRITVIDSQVVSMPLALLVLAASRMAAEGAGAAAAAERLAPLREAVRVYFMVATLEHLRRGGRIGRASALLGSVLQVKPVLTLQEGLVTPLERIRTQERALTRMVELARQVPGPLCAIVGHAAAEDAARRVAAALEPVTESLLIAPIGPVVGAHAGPGTVGVGCYPAALLPLGLKEISPAAAR